MTRRHIKQWPLLPPLTTLCPSLRLRLDPTNSRSEVGTLGLGEGEMEGGRSSLKESYKIQAHGNEKKHETRERRKIEGRKDKSNDKPKNQ